MSNVTAAGAGADNVTWNENVVAPLLPSFANTSSIESVGRSSFLMVRFGAAPPAQLFVKLEFRGNGVDVKKFAALSFVSVQPPAFRKSAIVLLLRVNDAGPLPS